ncbi:hypothetical protein CYMTET_17040 [Cymbomonas tetramitiformis]|uniref:Protein kinase domain-containing protein n=1 Tax=Cymbomonas tetramitiformis TaxID=36881 RepID=A0AAE0GB65_9CHLO|nr:hypothetical protein CYMTET_17040 [Cymbomonas tetramitiformis]
MCGVRQTHAVRLGVMWDNGIKAEGAKALAEAVKSADCKLDTLNISGNGIGDEGAEALAETVKSADCKLHVLNLSRNGIGGDGAKALAEAVKSADCKLHTLDLSDNGIGDDGTKALAETVKSADCKLHTLDLSDNETGAEGAKALAEAVKSADCKLHTLNLSYNETGAEGAKALAEAVKSADCKLHTLNLSGNGIGGDGAKALAEAVKSADCKLDTLNLSGNGIGDEEAEALAETVKSADCKLHVLNLSRNGIRGDGAKALAEAVKSADCKLHMLNLSRNGIGGDGAKALAEAVKSADCKLDTLDLSCTGIGGEGAEALAEAVKSADCKVHTLNLSCTGIRAEGAKALAEAVKSADCKLDTLNLSYNVIKAEGAKALAEAVKSADCTLHMLDLSGCRHIGRDGGTALKESMNFSTCEIVGTDTHVANSISKEVLQQAVEVLKTRLRNVETAAAQKVEEQMTGMTYSVMLDVLKLWLDEEEQVSARVKEESQQVVDLLRESPNGREAHAAAAATRDSWQAYHKDVVGRVQAVLDSIQQKPCGEHAGCEPLVGSRRVQEAREGVTRHAPSNATMDKLAQIPVLQGIYARKAGDVAHIAHVGEQVKDLTVENATLKQRLSELRSKERQHEGGLEDELKETGELGLLFESQEICSSAEVMQRLIYSVAQLKHVKEAQVTTRRKRDQVRRKLLEVCHPHFPEVEVALRPMLKHRYQRLELEIHRTGLLMHEGSLRDYDAHFKSGMKLKELKTGRRSVCVMRRKGGTDDDLVVLKEIPLAEERAVRREIVLQATIKHPAILEVHGVFLDKSTYGVPKAYIELPYCRGGHLLEWCLAYDIAHHEKVSWEQLRTMLYSALQARPPCTMLYSALQARPPCTMLYSALQARPPCAMLYSRPAGTPSLRHAASTLQARPPCTMLYSALQARPPCTMLYSALQARPPCAMLYSALQARPPCAMLYSALQARPSCAMLYSALQGLGHLHALGYVHRDIKPENILVTHDRRAMLCDFGLCAEADRHVQSTTDHPAGPYTEGYKAPEIRDGKPASPASDMWAMGASIEALLGVTQAAGVPRELAPLVQRMRSENEALRPSVTQVLVDPVFAAVLQARAPHEVCRPFPCPAM